MSNSVSVIGATGLVGSELVFQALQNGILVDQYNTKNISKIVEKHYDVLYISAIHAKKWWANKNPDEDLALIDELLEKLRTVDADKVVFISTVDVYGDDAFGDESKDIIYELHPYGRNRLYAEREIARLFKNNYIVRLQGLVGRGLRKNALYDLKNINIIEKINPKSVFQWYPLNRLFSDIGVVIDNEIGMINLSAEPIPMETIIDATKIEKAILNKIGTDPSPCATYNVTSIYDHLFNGSDGYIVSAEEALSCIKSYFNC